MFLFYFLQYTLCDHVKHFCLSPIDRDHICLELCLTYRRLSIIICLQKDWGDVVIFYTIKAVTVPVPVIVKLSVALHT